MQMAVRLPFPYLCQSSKAFAECQEQKETGEHVCNHPPLLLVSVLLLLSELIHMHTLPLIALLHKKNLDLNSCGHQIGTGCYI